MHSTPPSTAATRRQTLTIDAQRQRQRALTRWDGEGGAGPDGPQEGWAPRAPLEADRQSGELGERAAGATP